MLCDAVLLRCLLGNDALGKRLVAVCGPLACRRAAAGRSDDHTQTSAGSEAVMLTSLVFSDQTFYFSRSPNTTFRNIDSCFQKTKVKLHVDYQQSMKKKKCSCFCVLQQNLTFSELIRCILLLLCLSALWRHILQIRQVCFASEGAVCFFYFTLQFITNLQIIFRDIPVCFFTLGVED